ncbi:MAG TPA: phosphonopyruvate decarboxylase [Candidatus Nanoarchaeia archaeon]|nr:phosphonopyruvate decarboxylase [Candidatus Nanoarchaeia archaeon]
MEANEFYDILKSKGFDFYTGVPCSFFKGAINKILSDDDSKYIAAANEGAAVALAGGAYLAGKNPVVMIQESGLGNTINPLTSLSLIYRLPFLMLISGRGYRIKDEPQHQIMGARLHEVLSAISARKDQITAVEAKKDFTIRSLDMPEDRFWLEKALDSYLGIEFKDGSPKAYIVKKGAIGEYELKKRDVKNTKELPEFKQKMGEVILSRFQALEEIVNELEGNEAVISTTGKISRELFTINDQPNNFYMQGSMGHASAIGLGVALNTKKKVYVLDGDGALIMHLGSLSTIGHYAPENLVHICLDNEAYGSTGSQATTSSTTALDLAALACGYKEVHRVYSKESLKETMQEIKNKKGPIFVLVKTNQKEKEVERITKKYETEQITKNFMNFLNK